jgi:hypothetical protein
VNRELDTILHADLPQQLGYVGFHRPLLNAEGLYCWKSKYGGMEIGASLDRTLSAVQVELATVVFGSRSGLCPSCRRVALWLLPSSERISAAVRA